MKLLINLHHYFLENFPIKLDNQKLARPLFVWIVIMCSSALHHLNNWVTKNKRGKSKKTLDQQNFSLILQKIPLKNITLLYTQCLMLAYCTSPVIFIGGNEMEHRGEEKINKKRTMSKVPHSLLQNTIVNHIIHHSVSKTKNNWILRFKGCPKKIFLKGPICFLNSDPLE